MRDCDAMKESTEGGNHHRRQKLGQVASTPD
jgi:hypothetical protein